MGEPSVPPKPRDGLTEGIDDPPLDVPPIGGPDVGDVVGSYRLTATLGEGGMGRVFRAEHMKLGRRVALKMLHPHLANQREAVARFFAEARAVNTISHEHIIEVTDFIEGEGGQCAYVMELLEGESLAQLVEREAPLAPERIAEIGVQIASAVGAVHAAGIIHRDLKPENVVLTTRGGRAEFVKLLDFGVAKLGRTLRDGTMASTGFGQVLGTPEYMAPEQLFGREIDARADTYALGVILYEMASGGRPFTGSSLAELAVNRATKKVPPIDRGAAAPLPDALHALVLACLDDDVACRPQTMREVEQALEVHRARTSSAGKLKAPAQVRSPVAQGAARLGRRLAAVFAALVVVLFAIVAGALLSGGAEPLDEARDTTAAAAAKPPDTKAASVEPPMAPMPTTTAGAPASPPPPLPKARRAPALARPVPADRPPGDVPSEGAGRAKLLDPFAG